MVVLGHWTIIAVDADGGILPHGVLDQARWTHPLTWIFQVMPIFFLVGGYSNALSWRSARRKGVGYAEWLRTRLRRLGIPLIPLLLAWLVIGVVAVAAGAPHATVQLASQMALITAFLPSFLLSGFLFEINSMPEVIQWITFVVPTRYLIPCLQSVFLAGDIWPMFLRSIGAMFLIGAVFFTLAARSTRKRIA